MFLSIRNAVLVLVLGLILTVALIYAIGNKTADEYKIVKTIGGDVRGIRKTTLLKNVEFYSFKGIPYAKPPIDDLRFKVFFHCCVT